MKFQRAKYKVGEVVEGTMWPGVYLVVGHGFTGSHGQERGCYGCKITDRIHRKWQWLGPDRTLRKISSLNVEAWHPLPGAPLRFRLRFVATLRLRLGAGSGLPSAGLLCFFILESTCRNTLMC
jgi:hypothetical protein